MTAQKSPLSTLPGWDIAKRMSEADDFEEQLRRAFELQPKYRLPSFKSDWRDTVGEGRG